MQPIPEPKPVPLAMVRSDFPPEFVFGASTAAAQTEGAWNIGGKGPSIWDAFAMVQSKRMQGQHGQQATDFYHRYPEDLDLAKAMGLTALRWSVAWSRVLPLGVGRPNEAGLDFYDRLTDACLERGIAPWVTLYHWDLPLALEAHGGWTNRSILNWFEELAALMARRLGDRVDHWMVINEPMVFTGAGHFLGIHAPGRRGFANFLPAMVHASLAIAHGGRVLRSYLSAKAQLGTTFSGSYIEPLADTPAHRNAALRADALLNRLYLEPVLGLGYPWAELPPLRRAEAFLKAGDEAYMAFDFDFLGLQLYTREVVEHSRITPYLKARLVHPKRRGQAYTLMNWEVYPEALYHMLRRWSTYPNMPPIVVTENGAAFPDILKDGRVPDTQRTAYIRDHLEQVLHARRAGTDVRGYFVWTLTDNFEWAEGYRPRFGLVHVDYDSQQRTLKDSGKWYGGFITGQEMDHQLA